VSFVRVTLRSVRRFRQMGPMPVGIDIRALPSLA
jgi:hypothetical protein